MPTWCFSISKISNSVGRNNNFLAKAQKLSILPTSLDFFIYSKTIYVFSLNLCFVLVVSVVMWQSVGLTIIKPRHVQFPGAGVHRDFISPYIQLENWCSYQEAQSKGISISCDNLYLNQCKINTMIWCV